MHIDYIENAYQALLRNRVRTLLTITGIAIGIASVTCILAISGGVHQMIGGQVKGYQNTLAVVRPGLQTRDPNALVNPIAQQSFSTSTLTDDDVDTIAHTTGVKAAVPIMTIDSTLKAQSTSVKDNVVLATTPDFQKVSNITMSSGQFLEDDTDNNTAVVGTQLAIDLFDTDQPIGQVFTMRGQQFTVAGVMQRSDNTINYNNIDLNHAVVVNFARGELFHQGRSQIQQIDVLADDGTPISKVVPSIRTALLSNHLGEEDFSIATGADITKPTNQLFIAVTGVMTAIAAISLFVGGIGIMNIMLVGVAERTREIGIRKAVGATHGAIVAQFLVESLIMSLIGGLLGYFFGYLTAFIVSVFLYFSPAFTWQTVVVAATMSLVVGVLFGLYPALKAARQNTIESLRQYH